MSALEDNLTGNNHFSKPGASNNSGKKVNNQHFVKLKQLEVIGGEDKGY